MYDDIKYIDHASFMIIIFFLKSFTHAWLCWSHHPTAYLHRPTSLDLFIPDFLGYTSENFTSYIRSQHFFFPKLFLTILLI